MCISDISATALLNRVNGILCVLVYNNILQLVCSEVFSLKIFVKRQTFKYIKKYNML